jgi:hypothetical protein
MTEAVAKRIYWAIDSALEDFADEEVHNDDRDLVELAEALHGLRNHRRAVSDLERELETQIADLMEFDQVNLGDQVTLERRRGSKRTRWQSEDLLREMASRSAVDENGVLRTAYERFEVFREAVRECIPLVPSLSWRAGALREWGIDPDEYATVEPGRVSVSVKVAET